MKQRQPLILSIDDEENVKIININRKMREELNCKGECLILNLQIQDYKMPVT